MSLPAINVEKAFPCFAFSVWMPISLADPNNALFASILYAHVCITYFKTTYRLTDSSACSSLGLAALRSCSHLRSFLYFQRSHFTETDNILHLWCAHVCITYFKTTYQPIIAHPSSGAARTKRGKVVSQTLSRRAFIL